MHRNTPSAEQGYYDDLQMRIKLIYSGAMNSHVQPPNKLIEPAGASAGDAPADSNKRHAGIKVSAKRIASHALFSDSNEVEIDHKGVIYRLRKTALGKLILTK